MTGKMIDAYWFFAYLGNLPYPLLLQQCSLWGAVICAQRQIYQFQPFWHKGNNETFMIIFILQ